MSTNKSTLSKFTGAPYNYDLTSPEEYYENKSNNYTSAP